MGGAVVKQRLSLAATITAVMLSVCASINAQCVIDLPGVGVTYAASLNFNIQGTLLTPSQMQSAINMWHTCGNYGTGFPLMSVNSSGTINITIQHYAGANPTANSACGVSAWYHNGSGALTGGSISIYDSTAWGQDCESTMTETIAHEIGHGLGMNDVGAGCLPDIMGPNNFQAGSRSVLTQDCNNVDNLWTTPQETPPPPPPSGGVGTVDTTCDGTTGTGYCGANSPIILNLSRGGYELSGTIDPVRFDIDADGHLDSISWTARGAAMAFLALDRNGNGSIDDGSELFGNSTFYSWGGTQHPSNGFEALASYDDNGDGRIDAADAVWSKLLLWIDWNHDGISQPEELTPITITDVTALYLNYHWTGQRDQFGNVFRYEVTYTRGGERKPYYDVYFVRGR